MTSGEPDESARSASRAITGAFAIYGTYSGDSAGGAGEGIRAPVAQKES